MSVLATAEFFVSPERTDEFLELLKQALPDTRGFDGCRLVETYVDQDQPGHVYLIEQWAERSNHEAYLEWRIENGMMDLIGPFVTAPLEIRYFDGHPDV